MLMSIGLIGLYLVYLEVNVRGKWIIEDIEYFVSNLFAPKLHQGKAIRNKISWWAIKRVVQ